MGTSIAPDGIVPSAFTGVFVPDLARKHQPDLSPRPPQWKLDFAEASRALYLRNEFVDYLRAYGRAEDDYAAAELIFDELVANVCFHAPGPIEVLVEWHGGGAMLRVSDAGAPIDISMIAFPDPYALGGRGLAMVNAFSATVCAATYLNGKTVSAALPVRGR